MWATTSSAGIFHSACQLAIPGEGTSSTYEYIASIYLMDESPTQRPIANPPNSTCIVDNNSTPSTLICTNDDFKGAFTLQGWSCQISPEPEDKGLWETIPDYRGKIQYQCTYPPESVTTPTTPAKAIKPVEENIYSKQCVQILGSHYLQALMNYDSVGTQKKVSAKHTCILLKEDKSLVCKYPSDDNGGFTLTGNLCQGTKWVSDPATKTYTCSK